MREATHRDEAFRRARGRDEKDIHAAAAAFGLIIRCWSIVFKTKTTSDPPPADVRAPRARASPASFFAAFQKRFGLWFSW